MTIEKEIQAKYNYADMSKIDYVSGAFGGFNSSGDFIANFYFETTALPDMFKIVVDESGIGHDAYQNDPLIVRNVKASISMNIETMKKIRNWLAQNIDDYEAQILVNKDASKL